jgi:hypothetical protein
MNAHKIYSRTKCKHSNFTIILALISRDRSHKRQNVCKLKLQWTGNVYQETKIHWSSMEKLLEEIRGARWPCGQCASSCDRES